MLRIVVAFFIFTVMFGAVPGFSAASAATGVDSGPAEERAGGAHRDFAAQALKLNDCVRMALERNPNLRAAKKEQSVQALEKPLSFSAFLPTLDVEGTYTRFGEKQRLVPAHDNDDPGVCSTRMLWMQD